jgi:hypothetical protein
MAAGLRTARSTGGCAARSPESPEFPAAACSLAGSLLEPTAGGSAPVIGAPEAQKIAARLTVLLPQRAPDERRSRHRLPATVYDPFPVFYFFIIFLLFLLAVARSSRR